jgi:hypothetical protein
MSLMATKDIYTEATGVQWVICKAFLEIIGEHKHVLLLVSDFTGLVHHVVHRNRFLNGDWRLVHVNRYSIEFDSDGIADVPHRFDLHRRSDTSVWVRPDVGRFFIEAHDATAMIAAYPPQPLSQCRLPPYVVGNIYSDVTGIHWHIHKAFVEIQREFRNVLLLICDSEEVTRRVVFQNKFVNGRWEPVHKDHYRIKFNCKGVDADAQEFDYHRRADTSVWMRFSDQRAFVEALDVEAMIHAYQPHESG